jgi:hypothetical protein
MNTTVDQMLEEKGIDEAFLINAVESMAMILRGNNYTEQFMPASYNLPKDKSLEKNLQKLGMSMLKHLVMQMD